MEKIRATKCPGQKIKTRLAHVGRLEPCIALDHEVPRFALLFKRRVDLFAVCYSSNQFNKMPIVIGTSIAGLENLIPILSGWVAGDFIQVETGAAARSVYDEIHAPFPLKQANFGAGTYPGASEDGREKDGAIQSVYEDEIIFNYVWWMLGSSGTIDWWIMS